MDDNSVTKKGLNKGAKIGIAIVGVLIFVCLLVFFLFLKPTYEACIPEYTKAYTDYSDTKKAIIDENEKLNGAINNLQDLVSSDEKPYDPETIVSANAAINEGKIALGKCPDFDSYVVKSPEEFSVFQAISLKKAVDIVSEYGKQLSDSLEKEIQPAYSAANQEIEEANDNLSRSIKQLQQVTCPKEAFILERMTNIRDDVGMVDLIALTEDTDTENHIGKSGWYYSKVIFQQKDVDHYGLANGLLTLAEVGNPAGGCVEAFNSVEDAEARNDYLTSIEGTVRSPGAHVVVGTLVVRVTEDIKTSVQQEILNMMVEELLRLE